MNSGWWWETMRSVSIYFTSTAKKKQKNKLEIASWILQSCGFIKILKRAHGPVFDFYPRAYRRFKPSREITVHLSAGRWASFQVRRLQLHRVLSLSDIENKTCVDTSLPIPGMATLTVISHSVVLFKRVSTLIITRQPIECMYDNTC